MLRTWRAPRRSRSTRSPSGADWRCCASTIRAPVRAAGASRTARSTRWLEEALAAIDELTPGPLIIVGSSMGGWIALHLALLRPDRVQALVGIAAAPDFTEWGFTPEQAAQLADEGRIDPRILGIGPAALARRRYRGRLPGPPAPRRVRRRGAARHRVPYPARASFSRCPADCAQGRRSPAVRAARDRRDPAHCRRPSGACPLIAFLFAVAVATAAPPASGGCPDLVTPDALVCRALDAQKAGR